MFLANFLFLFVGLAGVKVFSMITLVPRTFLWPSVFILAMIGAYAYRQTSFDVWVMLISGLIGFFALRHVFGPAPFVMGLVLGSSEERRVGNGWVSPCSSRRSSYHEKNTIIS